MDHTLKLLKQMAHGIAKQFGTSCEVVIHDLNKDLETSIVHIENGQVTHRKSGDGPSGIVLETLHKNAAKVQDKLSYLTRTEDGRILKSSTFTYGMPMKRFLISFPSTMTLQHFLR